MSTSYKYLFSIILLLFVVAPIHLYGQALAPGLMLIENTNKEAKLDAIHRVFDATAGIDKSDKRSMFYTSISQENKSFLLDLYDNLFDISDDEFRLFGEGSVRDNIENNHNDLNVAGGSIGGAFRKNNIVVGITFNLSDASAVENIDPSYLGGAFISPNLEGTSVVLEAHHRFKKRTNLFLSIYTLGSTRNWVLDGKEPNAGILSSALKLTWMPFIVKAKSVDYVSLSFDFGITHKKIFSDVAGNQWDEIRNQLLSTTKTNFYGIESSVNLRIGKTIYFAKLPTIFGTENTSVEGLTGTRLVIGAKVTADFLQI